MDNRQKEINNLKDYKYGFSTDIENIQAPKGLNEDVIKFISNIKKEPAWMLEFRLKAFERLQIWFFNRYREYSISKRFKRRCN